MKPVLVLLCISLLLCGCWDMKEAQNINFITALGVDYEAGKYVVYAQIIDFPSISKREGTESSAPNKQIWVGKGEGESVLTALNDIYDSSQQQTLWTHVKAIVLSERVLKDKLEDVFSGLLRSREMRYTPWVFGSKGSIASMLTSSNILNLSAQTTELFEPTEIYKQRSEVEPIHLQKLMNGIREPGGSVLLPSITNVNEIWSNQGKRPPLIRMDGVYMISKGTNQGYIPKDKLGGARLVKFSVVYSYMLPIETEDGRQILMIMRGPRASVTLNPDGDTIHASIRVSANVNLIELQGNKGPSVPKLRQLAIDKLQQEFRQSMDYAQKEQVDIFGFEEELYRHHYKEWKRLTEEGKPVLPLFELQQVDILLNVRHSNTYNVL